MTMESRTVLIQSSKRTRIRLLELGTTAATFVCLRFLIQWIEPTQARSVSEPVWGIASGGVGRSLTTAPPLSPTTPPKSRAMAGDVPARKRVKKVKKQRRKPDLAHGDPPTVKADDDALVGYTQATPPSRVNVSQALPRGRRKKIHRRRRLVTTENVAVRERPLRQTSHDAESRRSVRNQQIAPVYNKETVRVTSLSSSSSARPARSLLSTDPDQTSHEHVDATNLSLPEITATEQVVAFVPRKRRRKKSHAMTSQRRRLRQHVGLDDESISCVPLRRRRRSRRRSATATTTTPQQDSISLFDPSVASSSSAAAMTRPVATNTTLPVQDDLQNANVTLVQNVSLDQTVLDTDSTTVPTSSAAMSATTLPFKGNESLPLESGETGARAASTAVAESMDGANRTKSTNNSTLPASNNVEQPRENNSDTPLAGNSLNETATKNATTAKDAGENRSNESPSAFDRLSTSDIQGDSEVVSERVTTIVHDDRASTSENKTLPSMANASEPQMVNAARDDHDAGHGEDATARYDGSNTSGVAVPVAAPAEEIVPVETVNSAMPVQDSGSVPKDADVSFTTTKASDNRLASSTLSGGALMEPNRSPGQQGGDDDGAENDENDDGAEPVWTNSAFTSGEPEDDKDDDDADETTAKDTNETIASTAPDVDVPDAKSELDDKDDIGSDALADPSTDDSEREMVHGSDESSVQAEMAERATGNEGIEADGSAGDKEAEKLYDMLQNETLNAPSAVRTDANEGSNETLVEEENEGVSQHSTPDTSADDSGAYDQVDRSDMQTKPSIKPDMSSTEATLDEVAHANLDDVADSDSDLIVSVVTWNLAEESPTEEDALFIKRFRRGRQRKNGGSDLVLISGQECENIKPRRTEGSRSREFRRLMIMMLGRNYVPIALHLLGGIQFGLFCKRSLLSEVEQASIADVTCGIGNVFHNKGAIGCFVRMKAAPHPNDAESTPRAKSIRMLFVTAHMAAHVKNTNSRDADFWRIVSELEGQAPSSFLPQNNGGTEPSGTFLLNSVDRIFFCGDLNYRIDLPREEVEYTVWQINALKKSHNLDASSQADKIRLGLLEYDQLYASMALKRSFPGFAEGRITFNPTFKYDKGTDEYDTSHKQRIPAWTDRVLFKPRGTRVLEYDSVHSAQHSDHRPVFASFRVSRAGKQLQAAAKKRRKRTTMKRQRHP